MLSKTIVSEWREINIRSSMGPNKFGFFVWIHFLYVLILFPCFTYKVLEDKKND